MWHCLPKPWECLYFAGGLESFSPAFLADNANKFRVMCGLSVFSAKGKGLLIKMPFVFYRKSCPFSYGWRISLLKLGLLFFLCSDLRVTSCILLFSTYKPPQVKHSQVYIIQWLKYFQHKILSDTFCKIFPKLVTVAFPGNVKSQLTWRSALTEPSICQCWEGAVSSGGSCVGADMCAVLHTGDNSSPCWSWFFNAGNLVLLGW